MTTYTINRVSSKTGKATLFFPTIEGKRINSTNFARKWEAHTLAKEYMATMNAQTSVQ